jgi:two-component system CheB/CheR fusion protein
VPVVSDAAGLMSALQRFADEVEDVFHVACRFDCDQPVLLGDVGLATHLFHLAQEAVNNAIKHGRARHIRIGLSARDDTGRLTVEDDGVGLGTVPASHSGMGLLIMGYRANMIGGSLDVGGGSPGGTLVHCVFPMPPCP